MTGEGRDHFPLPYKFLLELLQPSHVALINKTLQDETPFIPEAENWPHLALAAEIVPKVHYFVNATINNINSIFG